MVYENSSPKSLHDNEVFQKLIDPNTVIILSGLLIKRLWLANGNHIKNLFTDEKSSVKTALQNLNKLVGWSFGINVPWDDVCRDLKEQFPDNSKLIPTVCVVIERILSEFQSVLESGNGFADLFLSKMEEYPKDITVQVSGRIGEFIIGLNLFALQTQPNRSLKPVKVTLATNGINFILPVVDRESLLQSTVQIGSDLQDLFKGSQTSPSLEGDSDWLEVNSPAAPAAVQTIGSLGLQTAEKIMPKPRITRLPKLTSLDRPENLFKDILPYIVLVRRTAKGIEIEGNHSPTLVLIAEYFRKYLKKDLQNANQDPFLEINLCSSNYGSGLNYDVLKIERRFERNSWVNVGITSVLSFIEGVCGYDFVSVTHGSEWFFKRGSKFDE
ncbi:hypothetical protein HK098_002036 [Nowakowskiella sp. JEL0407]|nr:hypothetical protein HK098_002036 [Nowakowskiella sp. JEL0407]